MSKLVDKLQNLSQTSVSPMGFHSMVGEQGGQSMLLIAGLSRLNVEEVDILTRGGVDAGLIMSQSCTAEAAGQMVKAAGKVPLGVLLRDIDEDKASELACSGCDFAVLHTTMPATVLHRKEMGMFLVIDSSLESNLVRAINGLEVDGVLLDCGGASFITVEHLLMCWHFRGLLNKSLMVILPFSLENEMLGRLWEMGVEGIVIPATESIEAFVEQRKGISTLPRRNKRGWRGVSVTLPRYDYGEGEVDEEDDI